jgi:hypothetical protein
MLRQRSGQLLVRLGLGFQIGTLALLVAIWLGLTSLLIVSWGRPEAILVRTFGRFSMHDAFDHLNDVSTLVWSIHSILVLVAVAAWWQRRTDVFTVLMIGPVIAATIVLIDQRWTDPNWCDAVAVLSIGPLVGLVVGLAYWVLKPRKVRPGPSLDDTSPDA